MGNTCEMRAAKREKLWKQLVEEYEKRFSNSHQLQQKAVGRLVDGGSHTARLFPPYPCWIRSAQGSHVQDLDDHNLIDFWQGHFANLLGHNPPVITHALADALDHRYGLQTGMQHVEEEELAELICRCVGAEKVRFTTSGSLATMYAILLARTYTGRQLVLKVGGGWHGAQPWGLKGVHFGAHGYDQSESEGLPTPFLQEILVTRFNDPASLEENFRKDGDRIACFIVEPFIGGGGLIAAQPAFLETARRLTSHYGALLIFDEIISGFRFRAGPLAASYGIEPDLMTLGKIIGGGMPVACVTGRADVLDQCGKRVGRRARFEGGTYSAHPLAMLAGGTMLRYLIAHENEIYPALNDKGARLRQIAQRAFESEGIEVHLAGEPSAVMSGSSMFSLNFPYGSQTFSDRPDVLNDPEKYDIELKERVAKVAFLLEGAFVIHAGGALSEAHSEEDLEQMKAICQAVAHRFQQAGLSGD